MTWGGGQDDQWAAPQEGWWHGPDQVMKIESGGRGREVTGLESHQ